MKVWLAISPNDGTPYLGTVSATREGAKHWHERLYSGAGVLHRAELKLIPQRKRLAKRPIRKRR